jgi:hypothetical protein
VGKKGEDEMRWHRFQAEIGGQLCRLIRMEPVGQRNGTTYVHRDIQDFLSTGVIELGVRDLIGAGEVRGNTWFGEFLSVPHMNDEYETVRGMVVCPKIVADHMDSVVSRHLTHVKGVPACDDVLGTIQIVVRCSRHLRDGEGEPYDSGLLHRWARQRYQVGVDLRAADASYVPSIAASYLQVDDSLNGPGWLKWIIQVCVAVLAMCIFVLFHWRGRGVIVVIGWCMLTALLVLCWALIRIVAWAFRGTRADAMIRGKLLVLRQNPIRMAWLAIKVAWLGPGGITQNVVFSAVDSVLG